MATLAAHDQENAVRSLQLGPGGKPLGAGSKSFNAKTPGNKAPKTPFKVPLNDENDLTRGGKSVLQTKGKGNENLLMTTMKGGKLDANAFMTPAGPPTRIALGMKTTNAKGTAFQTPAPRSSARTQKASPRLRRPKVKVHQPEVEAESEDDVPEVEYMPPKEVPLPDDMDDYLPKDWKFPMFEGENSTRGIWEAYHNPVEADGRTRLQRQFDEGLDKDRKKRDIEFDRMFEEQMAKEDAETRRYFGVGEPAKKASTFAAKPLALKKTVPSSGPSTLRARSAATALTSSSAPRPNYAAPTAAAKSRLPSTLVTGRKPVKPLNEPTASRQATASAASKSTIGYAQGRAARVGSLQRKPLSNVTKPAPFTTATRRPATASALHNRSASATATTRMRPFSRSSSTSMSTNSTLVARPESQQTAEDVEREMEMIALQTEEDEDMDAWMQNFDAQLHGDVEDEGEEFQMKLPEGF